jgi:hypothetical protein
MTLEDRLISAVAHFWATRSNQDASQGSQSGSRDAGNRAAVTGGKQLDGFVNLLADLIEDEGMPRQCLHASKTTLPGYFRPEKDWDFLVVAGGQLIATVEFKSQVGPSFGNNFNNRVEEAVGNATDLNTAFREGAFRTSARPWIGYLMLLESTERSLSAVRTKESHFPVFDDFRGTSYAQRYELLCTRLVRERLYDASCLLLSTRPDSSPAEITEPNPELSFFNFVTSLQGRIRTAVIRLDRQY